jgi:ribosomal protein L24
MAVQPKFDYGDAVQVLAGEYKGRAGEVVGVSPATSTYTVEFGDGTDVEIAEVHLVSADS